MTMLVAALLAVTAAVATLLLLFALGRVFLLRWRVRHRTRRMVGDLLPDAGADADNLTERVVGGLQGLTADQRGLFLLVWLLLMLTLASSFVLSLPQSFLLGAGLFLVTWRYLAGSRARRQAQIQQQLPAALRMMAAATESGHSILQALERMVGDLPRPIAEEFAQALRAVELGMSLDQALGELARRNGEDFELFASMVSVQHRTGGNLPRLLLSLAASIQGRLVFRAEVQALTAQARFSGWVLSALPFGVLAVMMLVSPAYIGELFVTRAGQLILILGGALLVIGLGAVRLISRVEL